MPAEGRLLAFPANGSRSGNHSRFAAPNENKAEEPGLGVEAERRSPSMGFVTMLLCEGELMSKLYDLLHSPLGAGIALIVDELHQMMAKSRNLSSP